MMEHIRRAVRGAVGYDSMTYRFASRAYVTAEIARREGIGNAIKINRLDGSKSSGNDTLRLNALEHPIEVRAGTPDIATIINNVIREEYGQSWLVSEPKTLLDAGAYIGDTTAYFLSRFSGLHAVALEPDPNNLALAERNLAPYGERANLINAALDGSAGRVRIDGAHDGAGISEQGVEVDALTVPDVMERMGWNELDVLKMDIEGAEVAVLDERANAWLGRVRSVILEPHGDEIEAKVRATLSGNGFRVERYRSVLYCVRPEGGQ